MRKVVTLKVACVFLMIISCNIFWASSLRATNLKGIEQAVVLKKFTGIVLDSRNQPIVGATIALKSNEQKWALTDNNGHFTMELSPGDILLINYLGFLPKTFVYKGQDSAKIILEEDKKMLNEVVVTAMGIKRQTKALPYNVQEIKADRLSTVSDANFSTSLAGKVAGVTINSGSSGPGSATRVVMRGTKSISKGNNALYVIDGVPMLNVTTTQGQGQFSSSGTTDNAADINPDDIESLTVLTGASAAALYGSQAANGAIIITTKKGNIGKIKADYSYSSVWGRPFRLPEFQNIYGSDGQLESWGHILPNSIKKYSVDKFFQTSLLQNHNVSINGGSKHSQIYASFGSTQSKGMIPNNFYDRYNFMAKSTNKLLNDALSLEFSANYIKENHRNMINQGEYMNPMVAAYLMPRSIDNEMAKNFETYDEVRHIYVQNWAFGKGDYTLQNPYWQAYRNLRTMNRNRYILSAAATYNIIKWSQIDFWNISARINADKTFFVSQDKRYAGTESSLDVSNNGYYGRSSGFTYQSYANILSTLNKQFNIAKTHSINLNLSIGASYQYQQFDNQSYRGPLNEKGFPNLFNIFNIDQAAKKTIALPEGWQELQESIFSSAEIGWDNYLFLSLTGRNDWASQLVNSPKMSFFYPSLGLSAVITEMLPNDFKHKIDPILSYLKLRTAISSVASPFQRGLTTPTYQPDAESKTYTSITSYPVGELYPERTNSYEIGLTARLFKGLLNFDLSLYRTNTMSQTISVDLPPASGYKNIYIQTGNVRNQGVELSLGLNLGSSKSLAYSSNFTLSYNQNKIIELASTYKNPITKTEEHLGQSIPFSLGSLNYVLRKGGTLGDIYSSSEFARDEKGNLLIGKDGGLSIINLQGDDMIKLGSVLPDVNMGWNNEIRYKGFSISALINARFGGRVVSMTQAAMDHYGVSAASAKARTAYALDKDMPNPKILYQMRGKNRVAQYYTYSASNIRIAQASISYHFNTKFLPIVKSMTCSVIARNLALLYCEAPFDPETISSTENFGQGLDYFMLPSQRTFGFSVKLSF